jgi:hypothetical protein
LAIVRAIAEAHEGHVLAGGRPEGGARITLDLPGFTAADGSALDAGSTAGEVNGTARDERTEAH